MKKSNVFLISLVLLVVLLNGCSKDLESKYNFKSEVEMYELKKEVNVKSLGGIKAIVERYPEDYIPNDEDKKKNLYPEGTIIEADAFLWNKSARFVRWKGDVITYGSQNPIYFEMNEDKTIYAQFAIGHTIYK